MATIMIVEDDFFILQSAQWIIEDLGHDTLLASDVASAALHLAAPHPIAALFVDIRLHTLAFGGIDVANQAVGHRPALPVLYTSGCALTDELAGQFVPGGRFLPKPYSATELQSAFAALLS